MKARLTNNIYLVLFNAITVFGLSISCVQQEAKESESENIILSVNAYSFSDLLMARDYRDNQQVYTLFNLLDWCATQNIKALDPTGYFFPKYPEVPSDEYIEKFKNRAAELGVAISGRLRLGRFNS